MLWRGDWRSCAIADYCAKYLISNYAVGVISITFQFQRETNVTIQMWSLIIVSRISVHTVPINSFAFKYSDVLL